MEDDRIVTSILNGEHGAYTLLVERYHTLVYQVVYSVLHHPKDAEDASQEVFLQIFRSLPQYRRQGLKTWIARIALNKAIDMRRYRKRRPEYAMETNELALRTGTSTSTEDEYVEAWSRTEYRRKVQEQFSQIPKNYREVMQAYYLDNKTYQSIAEEQNMAIKTVESKLYRARHWMKKHWKEEDFE